MEEPLRITVRLNESLPQEAEAGAAPQRPPVDLPVSTDGGGTLPGVDLEFPGDAELHDQPESRTLKT